MAIFNTCSGQWWYLISTGVRRCVNLPSQLVPKVTSGFHQAMNHIWLDINTHVICWMNERPRCVLKNRQEKWNGISMHFKMWDKSDHQEFRGLCSQISSRKKWGWQTHSVSKHCIRHWAEPWTWQRWPLLGFTYFALMKEIINIFIQSVKAN